MGPRRSSVFPSLLLLAVVSLCIHLSRVPVVLAAADRIPCFHDHNALEGLCETIKRGQLSSVSMKPGGGGGRKGGGFGGGDGERGRGFGGRGGFPFGWHGGGSELSGGSLMGRLALGLILAAALLV